MVQWRPLESSEKEKNHEESCVWISAEWNRKQFCELLVSLQVLEIQKETNFTVRKMYKIWFLAALMFMYRSGREETLKQFCGVIPGDRATRGFLDPADVSYI